MRGTPAASVRLLVYRLRGAAEEDEQCAGYLAVLCGRLGRLCSFACES